MHKQKYLLVISGPTASGKTRISIDLAKQYQSVILSADSRQFYREMTIGTAKPTEEELAQVPHYFINSQNISEKYTVGDFEQEALQLLKELFLQHDIIILVGGSGLYIQALCEGLDVFPDIPKDIRTSLIKLFETKGIRALQEELKLADPSYYATVDLQNPQRLIRALEVCRVSGKAFSAFRKQKNSPRSFIPIYIQMQWPREKLYERINQRVDQMMEAGLLQEVKRLQEYQHLNALQTVGYQEFFPYLAGDYPLETAIDLLKRNTRRYAKRQLTWNRRKGYWKHFHPEELSLLNSYLSWAIAGGRYFFWQKKSSEPGKATLEVRGPGYREELLDIQFRKKALWVSQSPHFKSATKPLLLQFALHEVVQRHLGEKIYTDLPASWQEALQVLPLHNI